MFVGNCCQVSTKVKPKAKRPKTEPPRLPETAQDAELAVLYLGALSKGDKIGPAYREFLLEVIGALPQDPQEARWWKTLAKQVRRRLAL